MAKRANATSFGQKNGNDPTKGGAKKGAPNTGRPTNSFKHFLANLRNSAAAQKAIQSALEDPKSRGFNAALKLVADYDDEKPAEKKQIGGKLELTVRIEREGRRTS